MAGFPWKRLLFLIIAMIVFRLGAHIPVPGIDSDQLSQLFGKQFAAGSIRYILRNEAYKGDRALLKQQRKGLFDKRRDGKNMVYLERDHEAIIDSETWERAQKSRIPSGGLKGKIICADCGSAMVRRTLHGHDGYYKAWGCPHHCGSRNVREDKIVTEIERQVGSVEKVDRMVVGKDISVEQV